MPKTASSIALFAAAPLVPAACILAAALIGGGWVWVAFLVMTLLVVLLDRAGMSFEAAAELDDALPVAVACAHVLALGVTLWAVGHDGTLDPGGKLLLVVTMGLYAGQVSNACAHELIHRASRKARALGVALYCSVLNGQHVSAHLLVHHVHAATAQDPNSAPTGRGFYRYALDAALQEFTGGLRAETRRRTGRRAGLHPYVVYLAGAALALLLAMLLGGIWGLVALLAIALHAQMQLLLSDYVQHYGLRRSMAEAGKPEPIGPQHSWNAPQKCSAALMLNAPRHSDHHMNPTRPFTALTWDGREMPTLPFGLPVMGAIALIPPVWRRMMDPRVRAWNALQPAAASARPAPVSDAKSAC